MRFAVFLLGLLLTACASTPKHVGLDPAQNRARDAYLQSHPDWSFRGRMAYSHQGQGGTAQVSWRQSGKQAEIVLSGPLSLGAVTIRLDAGTAHLYDASGRLLQSGETEPLLQQTLKVAMPVTSLLDGLRAYWPQHADIPYLSDANAAIEADGWQWRYQEWYPAPVRLPKKLEATRADSRIRLIVDQWSEVADE